MNTGIFIDDTGNAGSITESGYDTTDRKSWLALILIPEEKLHAYGEMRILVEKLKREHGADEFHFKDIYNGKGEFKDVDLRKRKAIFQTFADFFAVKRYPMLIQTMTQEDWRRNKLVIDNPKIKADNFNLTKVSDFALFLLLFRIKAFLKSAPGVPVPVNVIIDEGRQKRNTSQKVEMLGGLLHNKEVQYRSSREELLLQLVDFAAYCLNRSRWIQTNGDKKLIDFEMLEIFSSANFNVLNMEKRLIKKEADTTKIYDEILADTYAKHSHLGNLALEDMVRDFYK